MKSLLRKAEDQGFPVHAPSTIELGDHETQIALILTEFPSVIEQAAQNYTPHVLADYAYRLAQAYSSFYSHCPVLGETDEELRQSRLYITGLALRLLEQSLDLLGIPTPERM